MSTRHLTGPSGKGSVVADIGGDFGVAIVSTPASFTGSEIEIRRKGAPWDGTHVAVRARHVAGGVVHAAFFPGLEHGAYEVRPRGDAGGPVTTITVEGGRVSETRLAEPSAKGPVTQEGTYGTLAQPPVHGHPPAVTDTATSKGCPTV